MRNGTWYNLDVHLGALSAPLTLNVSMWQPFGGDGHLGDVLKRMREIFIKASA